MAEPATLESTRDSGRGWPACGKAGPATLELPGGEASEGAVEAPSDYPSGGDPQEPEALPERVPVDPEKPSGLELVPACQLENMDEERQLHQRDHPPVELATVV